MALFSFKLPSGTRKTELNSFVFPTPVIPLRLLFPQPEPVSFAPGGGWMWTKQWGFPPPSNIIFDQGSRGMFAPLPTDAHDVSSASAKISYIPEQNFQRRVLRADWPEEGRSWDTCASSVMGQGEEQTNSNFRYAFGRWLYATTASDLW